MIYIYIYKEDTYYKKNIYLIIQMLAKLFEKS